MHMVTRVAKLYSAIFAFSDFPRTVVVEGWL